MDNCTKDCIEIIGQLDPHQMCTFTQEQCVQDTIQFIQLYYCGFHSSFILLIIIAIPLLYLLFQTLNNLTELYLTPCVDNFISDFKISPTFAGVTFLAFANGAPDVLTAIIAGSSDSDTTVLIPFGSIFGACLFSTAFILSSVIFKLKNKQLKVQKKQILIPLFFYILGISFLIVVSVAYGKMNIFLAATLLVFYIMYLPNYLRYIIIIVKTEHKKSKLKKSLLSSGNLQFLEDQAIQSTGSEVKEQTNQEQKEEKNSSMIIKINDKIQKAEDFLFSYLIPPFTVDQWQPVKTVISLAVSPVVMALTQDTSIFTSKTGPIPTFLLLCIPSLIFLFHIGFCIVTERKPKIMHFYTLYSFLITIAWLTLICAILINLLELLQLLTDINPVFLGLTFLAWANSIGGSKYVNIDYLSIVRFARFGNAETAVAGIFSGQLFNFLIGFGFSLLIQSSSGEYPFEIFNISGGAFEILSDSIIVLVICAGFLYLIYVFFVVIKTKGILKEKQGKFSRYYYLAFLVIALLLATLTDFFNEISCDI